MGEHCIVRRACSRKVCRCWALCHCVEPCSLGPGPRTCMHARRRRMPGSLPAHSTRQQQPGVGLCARAEHYWERRELKTAPLLPPSLTLIAGRTLALQGGGAAGRPAGSLSDQACLVRPGRQALDATLGRRTLWASRAGAELGEGDALHCCRELGSGGGRCGQDWDRGSRGWVVSWTPNADLPPSNPVPRSRAPVGLVGQKRSGAWT